jgi:photosystem II stability/assembly factor-like uncharacterized protein
METTLLIGMLTLLGTYPSTANTWECIGPDGGHFIGAITDPDNSQVITAVTSIHTPTAVYHSTDGGKTWARKGMLPLEAEQCSFYAFDVSRLYILYYHDHTCYFSKDGGSTWDHSTFPSTVSRVNSLCPHPTDPDIVFAAGNINWGQDNAVLLKSTDGGKSWTTQKTGVDFDPGCLVAAPTNPDILYMGGYKIIIDFYLVLLKSIDGGKTWADISDNVELEPSYGLLNIAIDPLDENRVYTGANWRFYRTADGGVTWTYNDLGFSRAIDVDPIHPANLYCIANDRLFTSNNYGQSWTEHPNAFDGTIMDIHVAPASPAKVYISSLYGGLHRSENWGGTWSIAHQGIRALPVPALAVAPSEPETVVMGGYHNRSLTASCDSGTHWHELVFPQGGYEHDNVNDILFSSANADTVMVHVSYG